MGDVYVELSKQIIQDIKSRLEGKIKHSPDALLIKVKGIIFHT